MMLYFWHIWSQSPALASREQKHFQPDAALYKELYPTRAALFGFSWKGSPEETSPVSMPGQGASVRMIQKTALLNLELLIH